MPHVSTRATRYAISAPLIDPPYRADSKTHGFGYTPKPGATYATDADFLHYAIEAWRVRDGGARIADPERYSVDYGNHLEPGHALERYKLIDPKKVFAAGGRGGGPAPSAGAESAGPDWGAFDPDRHVQTGTTSFVVADADGNMIAFTQTLSTWGGNYYVSKGLGFLYNRTTHRTLEQRLTEVGMRVSPETFYYTVEQGGQQVGVASSAIDTSKTRVIVSDAPDELRVGEKTEKSLRKSRSCC